MPEHFSDEMRVDYSAKVQAEDENAAYSIKNNHSFSRPQHQHETQEIDKPDELRKDKEGEVRKGEDVDDNSETIKHHHVQRMTHDVARFVALYEQSDEQLKQRQQQIEQEINEFKENLDEQLEAIEDAIGEVAEVMTAAGAARWRVAAEQALQQGEEHSRNLQDLVNYFEQLADRNITRIEKVTKETEKRLTKVISSLSTEQDRMLDHFKKRAQMSYKNIDTISEGVLQKFQRSLKWLRWEKIGIAFAAALIASFLTGLYLNAEAPWESSQRAKQERGLGRALLNAWPKLKKSQQEQIRHMIGLHNRSS